MSWASRRRTTYLGGLILFLGLVVGGPLFYKLLTVPATCFDGRQNEGETAPDKGGPCLLLDERTLAPWAVSWARSFKVRDGSYTAVAYIQNPNAQAGVETAHYLFGLYDSDNILIAETRGTTFIMPGGTTPVLVPGIDTGNRAVVHTYLRLTDDSLSWERMRSPARSVRVGNLQVSDTDTFPRVEAQAANTSFEDLRGVSFVAVVFDPAGNAFAASATRLDALEAGATKDITFTWPTPFPTRVGRVDITPLYPPAPAPLSPGA